MTKPLVSIVMPIYNASEGIVSALRAVEKLTYPAYELIIVDDGSSDDTVSHVQAYARTRENIVLLEVGQNRGAAAARNLGLSHARGTFVWFVDWDDEWAPEFLDRMVAQTRGREIDVVTCAATWRLSSGRDIGRTDGATVGRTISGEQALGLVLEGTIKGYLWNKLFRCSVLEVNPFPIIATQEDFCGVVSSLRRARRVSLLPDVMYHHIIREGSLTNSRNPQLGNLQIARDTIREAVSVLETMPRRRALLAHYDVAFYFVARTNTAMRLSSRAEARRTLQELRTQLGWGDIAMSLRVSLSPGIKATAMKILGTGYVPVWQTVVGLRARVRGSVRQGPGVSGASMDQGSTSARALRVLIRTLPLRRGNYGGVLQAYALQRAIHQIGAEVETDTSERLALRSLVTSALGRVVTRLTMRPFGYREHERAANRRIQEFVDTNLSTTRIFAGNKYVKRRKVAGYSAIVVGSDQVWRAEYGSIGSYMLDFVPADSSVRRIAYAASFGTDSPNVSNRELRTLAARFDALSVREDSAVQICREVWGVTADRMPDPTLLLRAEEYRALVVASPERAQASAYLACYVLDATGWTPSLIDSVARGLSLAVDSSLMRNEVGQAGSTAPRPGVEDWLRVLADSSAVVTDSFHGTVFSLIFEKPFVVIGNAERGMARFEALLSRLGLESRLVRPCDDDDLSSLVGQVMGSTIDWVHVRTVLGAERDRGLRFLAEQLRAEPT